MTDTGSSYMKNTDEEEEDESKESFLENAGILGTIATKMGVHLVRSFLNLARRGPGLVASSVQRKYRDLELEALETAEQEYMAGAGYGEGCEYDHSASEFIDDELNGDDYCYEE